MQPWKIDDVHDVTQKLMQLTTRGACIVTVIALLRVAKNKYGAMVYACLIGFYLAFDALCKMRYILWVAALLGVCDVIQNCRHSESQLGFLPKT